MNAGNHTMLAMLFSRRLLPVLTLAVAAVAVVVAAPRAEAQTLFWVGSEGPGWNSVNWAITSSTTANTTPVNGNGLRWGPASTQSLTSNNDFADLSVSSVSLQNAPANLVLGGNLLKVAGGFTAANAVNATVNLPLRTTVASNVISSSASLTVNGVISETNSNSIVQVFGGGTVTLNGLNTFTGVFRLGGGTSATVNINTLANKTSPQSLGQGDIEFGFASSSIEGGGSVNYFGGATTTDKGFRIGRDLNTFNSDPGVAFNNNGTGAVVWTGSQLLSTGIVTNMVFNLGGTNTDNNDWQSVIANNNNAATRLVGITKNGTGKWILSGANTYTGATTVSAGTLLVNGNQSGAVGAVSVAANAILGGTGTLGGASAAITGTVAPGLSGSLGTLTFAGSAMDFSSGGSLLAQLNSNPAVFTSDLLAISGAGSLTLGGTSTLDLTGPASFTTAGTYTLATFLSGTLGGQFLTVKYNGNTMTNPTAVGGVTANGQLVYNSDSIQLIVVPEPTALVVTAVGAALSGLAAWRRRRG